MDESYEDPRRSSSQGRYVGSGDAGGVWEPLTIAAPLGQYEGSGDAGGQWRDFTPEETAAAAANIEANRIADLERASGILAENPLSVTGNQIQTRFGDRDVSLFNPIASAGQPITGETAAQLVDPQTGTPVFLRDPNDPFSYTYDRTDTPAISGTLAQQAALYRPIEDKGVFGTLGGDLVSALKDPYFHKFLAATAAIAGGGMALNSAYGVGGLGAAPIAPGSTAGGFVGGATDILAGAAGSGGGTLGATLGSGAVDLAASLGMSLEQAISQGLISGTGALTDVGAATLLGSSGTGISGSTAGGFLGGSTDILAGAAGTGGGNLGAPSFLSGLGNFAGSITPAQAFQAARLALPVVGALTGGSRLGSSGQGDGQGFGGQGGGGQGGGQGYTQGPWNTFMNPTMTRQEGSGTTVMQNPELAMLEPSLANQLAQSGAIPSNLAGSNVPSANYYSYGTPPQTDYFGQSYDSPLMAAKGGSIKKPQKLAMGGLPTADVADDEHIPEFITGATGHYVKGRGDGQSDDIPAMLADGEYVFDADTVAQLGNGSSDAGAKFLDSFRHAVREHKRSAPVDKIPPKASPLQYVKAAMKRTS